MRRQRVDSWSTMSNIRAQNLERLARAGFRAAKSLPTVRGEHRALRPLAEIGARLFALDALFTWVAFPEASAASERVRRYAANNDAASWLTPREREIFEQPRQLAYERHVDSIGWRLENMWSLAWVLGFATPPALDGQMMPQELQRAMLLEFMPGLDKRVPDLLARQPARSETEVDALEDLFYCAHNAARSAQLGSDTVPRGFDPIAGGGVVHERRHALTWCMSPGIDWDATDLST